MGRAGLTRRRAIFALLLTAAAVLLLDQVSKALVRANIRPSQSVPVVGEMLRFTRVGNTGAAFGLLQGYQPVFAAISLIVMVGIGIYVWRTRPTSRIVVLSLGLLLGGAAGNFVDRVRGGEVTDFIEVPFIPVFNVADSAVVVGVALLVVVALLEEGKTRGSDDDTTESPR